jgi:rhamnogalacturonyl hydrolase YesR
MTCMLFQFSFSTTAKTKALPDDWQTKDVYNVSTGYNGLAGSADYSDDQFVVKGGGTGFNVRYDQFRYVYKRLSGNVEFVARMTLPQNFPAKTHAGIMLRKDTTYNAKFAFIGYNGQAAPTYLYKTSMSAVVSSESNNVPVGKDVWYKIQKFGSYVSVYYSTDGADWLEISYTHTNDFSGYYYLGLAVSSGDTTQLAQVSFSDVAIDNTFSLTDKGAYFNKKTYPGVTKPATEAAFLAAVPTPVLTDNAGWINMYNKAWKLAYAHIKTPQTNSGFVSDYYDEAFDNTYIYQWDIIFMTMFAKYAHTAFAGVNSLDNFYCKQAINGAICRMISESNGGNYGNWTDDSNSSNNFINPPLFSWVEAETYKATGDKSRFEAVLPVLEKYFGFVESQRNSYDKVHKLFWSNGQSSGMDNTPRDNGRSGNHYAGDHVGWVDISCQMVIQCNNIATICEELGKTAKAAYYKQKADSIAQRINQYMWNETEGMYFDVNTTGVQTDWKTIAGFWPLLAGITNQHQNELLIRNLQDPAQFWRPIPFPTLSKSHSQYVNTGGYWLGAVWAPTNFATIKGLERIGADAFAKEASEKYLEGLYQVYLTTGTLWENYAAELIDGNFKQGTNESNPPSDCRKDFVGWTGLSISLLIENVLGFRMNGAEKILTYDLRRTDRHGIQNLRMADITTSVITEDRSTDTGTAQITVTSDKPYTLRVLLAGEVYTYNIEAGTQVLNVQAKGITLTNTTSLARTNEVVEVTLSDNAIVNLSTLALYDSSNTQVPYQHLTGTNKIIFQATVAPNSTAVYTLKDGVPTTGAKLTYAAQKMPSNRNDIAWENDLAAHRMYSKVLLTSEPNTANGVDLWSKKQASPAIDVMYTYSNYHDETDQSNKVGVDAYSVNGKTLGAGGVAAYVGNKLWIHDPYDECQIIENGDLRSEFVLTYNKVLIDGDYYTKTVRITTTANGLLDKATVKFEGKIKPMKIAVGIYLHDNMTNATFKQNGTKFTSESNLIGHAENLTEGAVLNASSRFYEGVYMPGETTTSTISNHLVIMSDYAVGSEFTYYFGGGWNQFPAGRYTQDQDWFDALKAFKQQISNPLYETPEILPTKAEVINDGIRINALWQADHAATYLNKDWYSGVYHAGNMAFYNVYTQRAFLDYSKGWAKNNAWGLNGTSTADADNYTAGQTYIDLYNMETPKDPTKIAAIKARTDLTNPVEWWWIDAMYMAMPVYARMGVLTGDTKYYESLHRLFRYTRDTLMVSGNTALWTAAMKATYGNGPLIQGYGTAPDGLFNPIDGLWWRDWGFQPNVPPKNDPNNGGSTDTDPNSTDCAKQTPNGKPIYWGRGNGWAIGAMAHTLKILPADAPHRADYVDILQKMAAALKQRQRADGYWNMSLDDPDHRPGGETSGTALMTYGLAFGINSGLLDYDTYYPVVAKAWNRLVKESLQTNGVVLKIQGEGEAPIDPSLLMTSRSSSQPQKVAFGVGAFLMAASEVVKLAPGEMPTMPTTPLALDSVILKDASHLEVLFNNNLDESSAQDVGNYVIPNAPAVSQAELTASTSVLLTFASPMDYGRYTLTVAGLLSADGGVMDIEQNSKLFVCTVPLTPVDYAIDTITSTSGYVASNPPSATVDNDLTTYYSILGTNRKLTYDLGKDVSVYAVDIAFYQGNQNVYQFNVGYRNETASSYKQALSSQTSSGLTEEMERYAFPPQTARYIQLTLNNNTASTGNHVSEVRIRFNSLDAITIPSISDNSLKIYPNPLTDNQLTIEVPNTSAKIADIRMTDLVGRNIFTQTVKLQQNKAILSPISLPSGTYIVTAKTDQKVATGSLIVK